MENEMETGVALPLSLSTSNMFRATSLLVCSRDVA